MIEIPEGFDHGIIMMPEQWRPVVGYEGMYEISDFGRLKSFKRRNEKILKPGKNTDGYLLMPISNGIKRKTQSMHRYVAFAFIPNPENKPEVNHKNGTKDDNGLYNLEWVTPKENCFHADSTGLRPPLKGERNGGSKLKDKDVLEIRNLLKAKNTLKSIASKYGVHLSLISLIKTNKNWTHVI